MPMSSPRPTTAPAIDDDEWRLRCEVAACSRLLNDLGLLGYSGHVSARLPDRERFLIQSFDQPRSGLAPEDLLVCDFDGKVLAGPAGIRPPSEVALHCEILRARADVNSIAHFHHDPTTTFSLVEGVTLKPVKNHAVRWASGIPIHPDPSHVAGAALGRALVATLADHHALIIRAHGQVIVAESVPGVLIDSVHFVENAEAMYHAALLGPVIPLTEHEIQAFQRTFRRDHHLAKLWAYYISGGRAKGLLPAEWLL